MADGSVDGLARLVEEGETLARRAWTAQNVPVSSGWDPAGSVNVALDAQGRVSVVTVRADWQRRVSAEDLPGAVVQAVRDASIRRLEAWGTAFGESSEDRSATTAVGAPGPVALDRDDFQRRLHAAATGTMSAEDRRAALLELLELAEAIERGIDEVSDKLQATLNATYTGQSPDRHVTVTMTGGGEPTAVRFDRSWLREAHEINIGRQLTAAFHAAYDHVAAQGVPKLIADSALGEAQRRTQDPFGLAHRLRLTD
jgi:DNA-binding protein YbaB